MNPILLIPARMASMRLPRKPLADIGGVPMIVRVWARAVAADLGPVVVAAGEPEIAAAVEKAGGRAVLTDPHLPSGSDRIWAALQAVDAQARHDVVVNLQGDLPALDPDQLKTVVRALEKSGADIATLAAPIDNDADAANPAVVKAVVAWDADERLGRCIIMWGCTPIAARRWKVLSPCRLRRWRNARSWNSCAPWKRA
jgi:3-deoxy-manno-octulosonate cytidylyltransferase (CMP-KDO synthetase)